MLETWELVPTFISVLANAEFTVHKKKGEEWVDEMI